MKTNQLEMSFDTRTRTPARPLSARDQRRRRAQWWFAQMRLVVENAFDWRNPPPARPQQVYLTLT